jgi:hypothetical protein
VKAELRTLGRLRKKLSGGRERRAKRVHAEAEIKREGGRSSEVGRHGAAHEGLFEWLLLRCGQVLSEYGERLCNLSFTTTGWHPRFSPAAAEDSDVTRRS